MPHQLTRQDLIRLLNDFCVETVVRLEKYLKENNCMVVSLIDEEEE